MGSRSQHSGSALDPITSDARQLLAAFCKKESVHFKDFTAVWNELHFPFMYWTGVDRSQKSGIVDLLFCVGVKEMCQMVTESGHRAMTEGGRAMPEGGGAVTEGGRAMSESGEPEASQQTMHTLRDSIGGIFLLYSVFFTQPCQPEVLIRVTPSDWQRLLPLHEQIKARKYWDADYTLSRLRASCAFVITCTNTTMCMTEQSGGQTTSSSTSVEEPALSTVAEAVSDGVASYHKMKLDLSDYLPQHVLTSPTVSDKLKEALEKYRGSLSHHQVSSVERQQPP